MMKKTVRGGEKSLEKMLKVKMAVRPSPGETGLMIDFKIPERYAPSIIPLLKKWDSCVEMWVDKKRVK
jgi:hypothetical protein